MKYILFVLFLSGCAHLTPQEKYDRCINSCDDGAVVDWDKCAKKCEKYIPYHNGPYLK